MSKKKIDALAQAGEITAKYYEQEPVYREMDMRARMRLLFTEHYPLPAAFRATPEFQRIVAILTE